MAEEVLFVCPTAWDRRQLEACRPRWSDRWSVRLADPADEDVPDTLDPFAWVEAAADRERGTLAGVTSSSDYPGATLAALLADRLGLPGAPPERVLLAAHKGASRIRQLAAAPEHVPWFRLVPTEDPASVAATLRYPCFVKPVKGAFSVHARRIEDPDALVAFLSDERIRAWCRDYLGIFNRLVERLAPDEPDGRWFLAEELLDGDQVTVEGWVHEGDVGFLGTVDSVMRPGTRSFVRFDYPSSHPPELVARIEDATARIVRGLGLDRVLFNVEWILSPERDRLTVLEVNARMCGQFADLYEKVDGTNGYEVALAVATGRRPRVTRAAGPWAVAASVPLRCFAASRVRAVPGAATIEAVQRRWPDTLVWTECAVGETLADFESAEDGTSARYAVVNLGADDTAHLRRKAAQVEEALAFALDPA